MRPAWFHSRALQKVRPQLVRPCTLQRQFLRFKTYDAAVIGGGITGLTAAFRLSLDSNCTRVTLYEKSDRAGGWLQSERIPVDDGDVVFDYGPRTLRISEPASGYATLGLLAELDLLDQVLITSKKSPAATNRFLYYPDHLVRMPGRIPDAGAFRNIFSNLRTLLTEPVLEDFLSSVIREPLKGPREGQSIYQDESVAEFVSRRFSLKVADNMASAFIHGIYAGDIDRLSAQTLFGHIRDLENSDRGIVGSLLSMANERGKFARLDDIMATIAVSQGRSADFSKEHWRALSRLFQGGSVYTLRDGVGQLADRLVAELDKSPKVDVVTNAEVMAISQDPGQYDITVTTKHNEVRKHNRVIATNPAPDLAKLLGAGAILQQNQRVIQPHNSIRCLQQHNYAVTVMVVNLYYDRPDLLPVHGFGYLIPRSIPFDQNPERALGVIFGSDSSVGQDTAPGTKLTVMMGGHWWDGWQESDYPDHDSAVQMARSLLERHLRITDAPAVARCRLQKNAIPQYTVGHLDRMQELSRAVRDEFNHRLTLAGSWYDGVGVNDCIRQAYLAATFGVGALKLSDFEEGQIPFDEREWREWEMEGGIVTAPYRWLRADISES